ncbi:MAG: glycosyltransferase family 2 protein [Christensenellaceae bacterium]
MEQKLSFVIPCYRSESSIAKVVEGIGKLMDGYGSDRYEVILVNDASPDGTFSAIEKLCKENGHVTGLNLSKNFGQHSAIMAGLNEATGDIIVCMDDDGQTPPEEAGKLIDEVAAGHDIAMARYPEKKHGFLRNIGSKLNESMAKSMIGKPKHLFLSSFFAMKRYILDQLIRYDFPYPYITGMLLRTTGDIVNVDINHKERETGKSGYSMAKLLSLWFRGFTNFSAKPLRVAIVLGVIIAIIGFGMLVYAFVVRFTNSNALDGWASLMAAIVGIGGVILIVLGLVGEYIGRIYMGLNKQPQYVVRDKIKNDMSDGRK